jgi:hypothetical protein
VVFDIAVVQQVLFNVVDPRHDFPRSVQRSLLNVDIDGSLDHGLVPFHLIVIVDLAIRVVRIHISIFQFLPHYKLLACMVKSTGNSFGDLHSFFLIFIVSKLD